METLKMTKYKITIGDLLRQGGAAKLERDGFKRETIMKEMYKQTSGATTQERTKIVADLYARDKPC